MRTQESRDEIARRCICARNEEEEEEEEAVFISVVNTNEDPPNAYPAQHRPKPRV